MRAVAVALVIFSYLIGAGLLPPRVSAVITTYLAPGPLGVRVFFIISGYLITTLLLREAEQTGTVDLLRFYLRRTLRIFPAYYVYIGIVWLLAGEHLITPAPGDFLRALTYTVNSLGGEPHVGLTGWFLGHAWSLSVEEQFYLLWPAVLLLAGARRAWTVAVGVVLLGPLIKALLLHRLPPAYHYTVAYSFLGVVLDCLAAGCALAGLRPTLHGAAWYRCLLAARWFWVLAPVGRLCMSAGGHWEVSGWTQPAFLVAFTLCLDRLITYPATPVGCVFNWGPLAWAGRLSYSVYLWQQLFTHREPQDTALRDAGLNPLLLDLVLILVCALASYYLIERPSLRVRSRIEAAWDRRGRRGAAEPAVAA